MQTKESTGNEPTASRIRSLSTRSASLWSSLPRLDASILRQGEPLCPAALAASTALSTSSCTENNRKQDAVRTQEFRGQLTIRKYIISTQVVGIMGIIRVHSTMKIFRFKLTFTSKLYSWRSIESSVKFDCQSYFETIKR